MRERIEAVSGVKLRTLPPHVGGVVGSGSHTGFAELNRALRDTGEVGGEPRRRNASDAAVAEVDRRWDEAAGEVAIDEVTANQDRARRQVEHMTGQWHEKQNAADSPALIERGLSGRISGVEITGTPDLWSLRRHLTDTKSGKRTPRADVHGPQAGAYSMLLRARGAPVDSADLVWFPRTAKPRPLEIVPVDVTAAERAAYAKVRFLARVVSDFESAIDGDLGPWWQSHPIDVIPTNPQSLLCSPNWCRLYGTPACHAWPLKAEASKGMGIHG
jgi:hypothetical protein